MKSVISFNSYFIQFTVLIILIVSFGSLVVLLLSFLKFTSPNPAEPLGAPESYIIFNNVLKAFLALMVIHFYKGWVARTSIPLYGKFLEYALLGIILYFANGIMQVVLSNLFFEPVNPSTIVWSHGAAMIFRLNIMLAGLIVYHLSLRAEKREKDEISRKLEFYALRELKTKAELDALQSKVNPHFLYNALNSINTLVDQHPAKAKEMIHQLSKLFRLSINSHEQFLWSLEEELDLVNTYLSIEKVRFGEKLQVSMDCDETLMSCMVPKFVLQPLVENAIKHGISKIEGIGHIYISIQNLSEWIEMKVYDNGPSFVQELQSGYGLRSLYDKVKMIGEGSVLEISGTSPHKFVKIKLSKT